MFDKFTLRGYRDQLMQQVDRNRAEIVRLQDQLFLSNPVLVVGKVKIHLPLFYVDHIQKTVYESRNFYEIETLEYLKKEYKQFEHVLDIGSNMGNHMLYYCSNLSAKKVHCFEPNQFNQELLQKNISLNHLDKVVKLYPFALGAESGKGVQADFTLGNTGMNRINRITDAQEAENTVEIHSLDDLAIEQANFMKIDVEGFEVEVLKGAGETIRRCKPVVMIEVFETNRQEVDALMEGYGYRTVITLEDYNTIYVPF